MENIHISIVTTIALICFIFAARVFSIKNNDKVNHAFAAFAITTAIWIIVDFSLYQNTLANIQTILNRLDLSIICLMIVALSYFVTVFPREIFKIPFFIYLSTIILTIIMIFTIIFTNLIVHDAFMEDYGSNFNQGNLFLAFAFFATIFAIYSIIVLIIKYRKLIGEEKNQIKYIFYGIAFLTFFNLLFNLFIPIFNFIIE